MKKIFVLLLLALIITGCNSDKYNDIVVNNVDGVTMTIKEGSLTKNSATVIINETNKETIIYGTSFFIQKYEDGNWVFPEETGENYGFNAMAYYADENGYLEFNQNWEHMYKELTPGKYRLVKDIFFEKDIPINDDKKHYIAVEFTIS